MRLSISCLSIALLGAGCATQRSAAIDWRFEARQATGEVYVLPVLEAFPGLEVRTDGMVEHHVPWVREKIRIQRTEELGEVPASIGVALPGAVQVNVGSSWTSRFRVGHWPVNGRERLTTALRRHSGVDRVLEDLGRNAGGDAVLVCWVTELHGDPLTAEAFPGDIVDTHTGPVVVDILEEAYRVRATVGMALVTADGEVVLRYSDTFESTLSTNHDPRRAGRDIAMDLAVEVTKMWPTDPALSEPLRLATR